MNKKVVGVFVRFRAPADKHTYGKETVQNVIDLNIMVRGNSLGDLSSLKLPFKSL
jgi:hypothetical protein